MFLSKEKGQGLIEYALIIVLVSIVVIVVLALLGPAISNIFQADHQHDLNLFQTKWRSL